MGKKIIYLSLSLAWMCLVFWFSSQTADNSSNQSIFITERIIRLFIDNPSPSLLSFAETLVRKLAHFAEYFILAFFVFNTINSWSNSRIRRLSIITVAICCLYAISDEIHQYFVPGRACRAFDVAVDTAGSAFFCVVYYFFSKIFFKNRSSDD